MDAQDSEKPSPIGKMEQKEHSLKDIEIRILVELMRNSRRSDREIARVLGVSQSRVSRLIDGLEKIGIIKEYTMIPDFCMLGYGIMAVARLAVREPQIKKRFRKIRKNTIELEKNNPNAFLMAVNGRGKDTNRLFIVFYKSYSDYVDVMKIVKGTPYVNVDTVDTFVADLNDETNYRVLSMSAIANHLLQHVKKKETSQE